MPPKTTRYAGWLPPIVRGGGGWFPLKATSVAGIVDALSVVDSNAASPCGTLVRAFSTDPALVLFTIARLAQEQSGQDSNEVPPTHFEDQFASADELAPNELSRWWQRNGRKVWNETDWLAAPDVADCDAGLAEFQRLDDYFRVVPMSRWVEQSDPWFDAVGIANPIPSSWKTKLRSPACADDSPFGQAHLAIDRLVRRLDESDVRSGSFSEAVQRNKRGLAHRLAYGLSHEINNPLANISTRAQSLVHRINEADVKDSLQRIVDQTSRAHAMIADLMFYANPPAMNATRFDLIQRIERVADSARQTADRLGISIDIENGSAPTPIEIVGDDEMIGEAIAVLVKNSIEAIGTDGVIRLNVTVNECEVEISVADSGPGMTPQQTSVATDPYYSGREAGRGLGLGLCRADRIAELHGGHLELVPAIAGCVAKITLPTQNHPNTRSGSC
ncbi:sensor histidine kinase [Rhodopirellula sallentina]|uniref:histidine kinase n=1 Tax=Rhodopirellula sallentina SM41 TaxID=1263870 RepID=M5U7T3_9BACT|nr:HAMP domain-containing sensor histidine kinase [Rhodopirellula sallentina]EMI57329.1 ATP-binding region, ATPase-like domain protein [Rhodopirellula sallentina SM41]